MRKNGKYVEDLFFYHYLYYYICILIIPCVSRPSHLIFTLNSDLFSDLLRFIFVCQRKSIWNFDC